MGSPYPLLPPCSPFSTWQQVGSFKNQSDHVISLLKTFQGPPLTLGIKSKGFPLACGPYTIWPCLFPHLEPPPHLVPALQLPWRFLEPSLTFLTQDLCTCYLLCLEGPSPNTLLWLVPPRLPCHLLRAPPPRVTCPTWALRPHQTTLVCCTVPSGLLGNIRYQSY